MRYFALVFPIFIIGHGVVTQVFKNEKCLIVNYLIGLNFRLKYDEKCGSSKGRSVFDEHFWHWSAT